jgi:hypothetical protein
MILRLAEHAVVEITLVATCGLSYINCVNGCAEICGDFYDRVSKLATDLSFETSVIGYSFGINFQPNLFLNNP